MNKAKNHSFNPGRVQTSGRLIRHLTILKLVVAACSLVCLSQSWAAAPSSMTYQGRVLNPDGTALESASVVFTIQLRSSGPESCLLFEETHSLNMTGSDGVFSIVIGAGVPTVNSTAYSLAQVFSNSMTFTGLNCTSGTGYSPAASATRKLRVSFNDGISVVTITPDHEIHSVPFAMNAARLGGLEKSAFIQTNTTTSDLTQAKVDQLFQTATFTELLNLISGASTQYAKSSELPVSGGILNLSSGGVTVPNTPASATSAVNRNYVDSAIGGLTLDVSAVSSTSGNGKVLRWDQAGNRWQAADVSASPGGVAGQIQFNNAGSFAGDSNLNWDNTNKRLGVGTAVPAAAVDVNGSVKVGADAAACTTSNKGSIRYNNTTNVLEFCNGTGWNLVQAAACTDATPNTISFTNQANAAASTLYSSDIVQVTGVNCSVPVTISGQGSPKYRICSDSACSTVLQDWTSSPSSITTGQYLQTQLTTDIAGGAVSQATLIVGSGAGVWSVSNAGGDCVTGTPPIGTVCADGTIYAGLTPDGSVKMFTTRCDQGQTWDGSNCTGVRATLSWNNGSGSMTTTGQTGTSTGKSNSAYLAGLTDAASPHIAAQNCENLNANGKSDWYLPALTELSVLSANKAVIRNFLVDGSYYWSSTEGGASHGYLMRISDGYASSGYSSTPYYSKSAHIYVRCVRR